MGDGPVGKAIAAELRASAKRLGDSLYDLNYDDGFRLRTASGIWKTPDAAVESGGERPSFYEPSRDRRCVSNAAAVIFYSLLNEDADDDRIDAIGEKFLDLFFDEKARPLPPQRRRRWSGVLAFRRPSHGDPRVQAARRRPRFSCCCGGRDCAPRRLRLRKGRPVNHLGPFPGTRRRNSWHDAFAVYALALDGRQSCGYDARGLRV